jgi:hypothetical protein
VLSLARLTRGDSVRTRTTKPPLAVVDQPQSDPPSPPRKLGPTGLDLWARVQAEFLIDDCAGVELLAQTCETADLVQELSDCVARDGKMIPTKSGIRANPLLRDMLSARAFICTTLRRLGIVDERVARVGQPSSPSWRGPNVF